MVKTKEDKLEPRSFMAKSRGTKRNVLIPKTQKKVFNADVRRSERNAAQSGKSEIEEVVVARKRQRKPNLRYVDHSNVRPASEEETLRGTVVASTSKMLDQNGTTVTNKKIKKSRKRNITHYEVNCSNIPGLDIIAFQTYLKSEMKVAGKKSNPNLKIIVRGLKVVIKSRVYLAKKSLRYSTRKYFKDKKMYSVCVSNESKNSYKLTSKM